MKKIKIAIIIIVVLVVAWLYWQYTKAMKYELKLKNIIIGHFGLKKLDGSIYVDLYNPSAFSGSIISSDIMLSINNVDITKVIIDKNTLISASGFSTIMLDFDAIPKHILSIRNIGALQGITDPKTVQIGLKGWIKAKILFFTLTIPVNIISPLADYLPEKNNENER